MEPRNRINEDFGKVTENISRVRRRGFRLRDDKVTLAHGAGGKSSAALIEHVFMDLYGNDMLAQSGDSTLLVNDGEAPRLAMSTDSYVVQPVEFPGGSIGDLAVNGTVNDLAVSGADPRYLTISFILEEGLDIELLRRIVGDAGRAAQRAGVTLVAGDTKVVSAGAADRCYITTAGVGFVPADRDLGFHRVQAGDRVLLSGPIADHGMAVMLARGELNLEATISSDTREVASLTRALSAAVGEKLHWMRDATRGGLATVLNELAGQTGVGVAIRDEAIAVREQTRGACDVLGIDPLYVANEGTFVAVVADGAEQEAREALRAAGAPEAEIIGRIVEKPAAAVVLVNGFGGTRMVDMLAGDPLPRIC